MSKFKQKFKKGAASFYIVAFSTLILVVIAVSFTTVVLSEIARTSNDDLSQSAYDSALAGIEDAKVAFSNYQRCLRDGKTAATTKPSGSGAVTCEDIIWFMENPDIEGCDMVGRILGRFEDKDDSGEVLIQEVSQSGVGAENKMNQAYTCVKIDTKLPDYRSTLTEDDTTRVVRVRLDSGVKASDITRVKISWFSNQDYRSVSNSDYRFNMLTGGKVAFPAFRTSAQVNDSSNTQLAKDLSVPPMISVSLVQTAGNFSLSDFEKTSSRSTDRGTVFLVPTDNKNHASTSNTKSDYQIGAYNGTENFISAENVAKTNNRAVKNLPFVTLCDGERTGNEFVCSAIMELPDPIGGARSDETFMFVVTIPYGKPTTSFALEFLCADGKKCGTQTSIAENGEVSETATNVATLSGTQISIDSTGRANNLYRRIEARLEAADTYFPFPLFALELLDPNPGDKSLITKPSVVICEHNYDPTC